ncbi:MAG: hypothetical protein Q8P82_01005 [bacterium]|nr:hypothetical protein [bacterium]
MAQLIHVTDLSKQAFDLYRKHFLDFLRLLVWLLVPTILSALLPITSLNELSLAIADGFLSLIMIVISLWISVVLVDMIVEYERISSNEKRIREGSWGTAGRVVDFSIVSFLQGIVVALGFILFIIPGIIFAVWFSFSRYAMLIDGTSPGSEALRHSKALVVGRFWSIVWRWFGTYLYFGSLILLGTIALLALLGAVLGNAGLAFAAEPAWWATLIIGVVSVLVTPLFIAVGVLLYNNAKHTQ